MTNNQKWTIGSTSAGFALENMDTMFVSFALTSMIATLDITKAQAGFIMTMTSLGSYLGGILFGWLADKFGRVRVFSYTIFIFAIATAMMYFANNIYEVDTLRFLIGLGTGGEYGAGIALIAENFKGHKIAKLSSTSAVGGQIGAMIAAGGAAIIIPKFGWHALFLMGLIPALFAFLFRRKLHESNTFIEHSRKGNKVPFRRLFSSPAVTWQSFALIFMTFVDNSGYYGIMTWLPSIIQKQLHLNVSSSSLWMIVTIVGMSLGMMSFASVMDKIGPRLSYSIFLLCAAACVYVILIANNTLTLFVSAFIMGFFSDSMYGGYGVIMSRLYPVTIRATANNVLEGTGDFIGKGFAPLIMGFMLDHTSILITMATLSGLYICSFLVMLTIPNLHKSKYAVFEQQDRIA